MGIGMSAMPGCWADYYACWKGREVETIKRMLELHSPDFPVTCCAGFTIVEGEPMENGVALVKIYPKVRSKDRIIDYYTQEIVVVEDNI